MIIGCVCVLVSDLQADGDGLGVGFALPALELVLQPQQHRGLVPLGECEQVDSRGQRSLQPRELQTEELQLSWFQQDGGRGRADHPHHSPPDPCLGANLPL